MPRSITHGIIRNIYNICCIYIIVTAPLFLSLSEKVEICRRTPPPPQTNTSAAPDFPSLLCIQFLRQTGCLKLSSLLGPTQPATRASGAAVPVVVQDEEQESSSDRGRVVLMCAQAEDPVTASQCLKRAVCSPGLHAYQNIGKPSCHPLL